MLQPRVLTSLRALERTLGQSVHLTQHLHHQPRSLLPTISKPTTSSLPRTLLSISQVRHASHAAQGASNRHARDPAGKRLGAKRTGGEYVVQGCIIFRQRGTKWFPGDNCAMGRDHTIYAAQAGYVRYYQDPERHPDRRYIGVVFEKNDTLPQPRNAPTRRKLNMVAVPRMVETVSQSDLVASVNENGTQITAVRAVDAEAGSQLRPGYMYREANWQIGRAAEKAGITAKPFDRSNRWMAWRRRKARKERLAQMKSLKGKKGKKA